MTDVSWSDELRVLRESMRATVEKAEEHAAHIEQGIELP